MFGFLVCMNTIIKLKEEAFIMAGTLFDTSEDHPESTGEKETSN
jgi:hypothetical protein